MLFRALATSPILPLSHSQHHRSSQTPTLSLFSRSCSSHYLSLLSHKYPSTASGTHFGNNLITSLVHFKLIIICDMGNWKTSYQFIALLLTRRQACPV